MSRPFVRGRGYTDLAVVVGRDRRSVSIDAESIYRKFPESLLGYRVYETTSDEVRRGSLRGLRPRKVIVIDGVQYLPFWKDAWFALRWALLSVQPRVEHWSVHGPDVRQLHVIERG